MSVSLRLDGKVALVTGASGGLGENFARCLAEAGAAVVLAARRIDKLKALEAEIVAAGGKALAVSLDVTDRASVEAAVGDAVAALGPITILVNNSGIIGPPAKVTDVEEADWDSVIDTNLRGVWLVGRVVGRQMIAAGKGGSIINIASILGYRITGGVAAYAASKAAVIQLTNVMGLELARDGIRVNALAPGFFATDINREFLTTDAGQAMVKRIALRRFGAMPDLHGPLLLLASDASAYMTGSPFRSMAGIS